LVAFEVFRGEQSSPQVLKLLSLGEMARSEEVAVAIQREARIHPFAILDPALDLGPKP
jgi:hypothetical protein